MNDFFSYRKMSYNLRSFREIECENVNTLNCGLNTLTYKGSQLWQQIPDFIKSSENINLFKSKIKQWVNFDCPCNIYKNFIQGFGYI